jgi:6-phospho-beta-glucosidase
VKVTVVGAGSTYTPELAVELNGTSGRAVPPITELVLHDVAPDRLAVVAGFVRRILAAGGSTVPVTESTDLDAAVDGADFVLTQVRVGGQAARILDETVPLRHGCVGNETTGPGGFAMALRAVPVLTEIAERVAELAPHAWLVNFANPAGLVTEACRAVHPRTIGLCNNALTWERGFAAAFGAGVCVDSWGLNHLSWITQVRDADGQDRLPGLLETFPEEGELPRRLVRTLGALPNPYLRFFYLTGQVLASQLEAERTRAEEVLRIEADLLERYADPALASRPDQLSERGGSWYSTAAIDVIRAITGDSGQRQVLDVPNRTALGLPVIPGLPEDAIIEVPCTVDAAGAHPLPLPADPAAQPLALVHQVKAYERLAIKAALSGSREVALDALLTHPLVRDLDVAVPLLAELLDVHAPLLPRFAAA